MAMEKNFLKGLSALTLAAGFYGAYGIFSRLIGINFGVFYQASVRGLIISLLLAIYLAIKNNWQRVTLAELLKLSSLGILTIISYCAVFIAFNYLALATTLFVLYAVSTIASYALGRIFHTEEITYYKIVALAVALAGLIIIFYNGLRQGDLKYLLLAALAGLAAAGWYSLSKRLYKSYSISQILLVEQTTIFIAGLILAWLNQETIAGPTLNTAWLALIIFALITIFSDAITIYGFRFLTLQTGSLILLSEVIFGALFGFIIFKESLSLPILIGGILIITGVFISYAPWQKIRTN
ncbi:MAG: DMT family transporter [Candidatus Kerfeldbacteria bacterium]|nr:DMT family transporter [Candidatus Kerfeldbacteria bacterium]